MQYGPKVSAFVTACGVAAAGLGVVWAGLSFLPRGGPVVVVDKGKPEAASRPCNDAEREVVRASLTNYGRRVAGRCAVFSEKHEAQLQQCDVDLMARRINARGLYDWRGGVRKEPHQFIAAFSTDLSGTDIRVNVTNRSRQGDAACEF